MGKMISCSRHDTKACFPMNCHARISHCQGHAHRGEKRAKLIPRTYKQKRPAGTRSQLRHGAVQRGLGMLPQQAKWSFQQEAGMTIFRMWCSTYTACQDCAKAKDGQAEKTKFSRYGRPHALLARIARRQKTGRQENEVLCMWCHTCPACQDCAEAKDWQAGKRSFCMVCTTMPCLPGS